MTEKENIALKAQLMANRASRAAAKNPADTAGKEGGETLKLPSFLALRIFANVIDIWDDFINKTDYEPTDYEQLIHRISRLEEAVVREMKAEQRKGEEWKYLYDDESEGE